MNAQSFFNNVDGGFLSYAITSFFLNEERQAIEENSLNVLSIEEQLAQYNKQEAIKKAYTKLIADMKEAKHFVKVNFVELVFTEKGISFVERTKKVLRSKLTNAYMSDNRFMYAFENNIDNAYILTWAMPTEIRTILTNNTQVFHKKESTVNNSHACSLLMQEAKKNIVKRKRISNMTKMYNLYLDNIISKKEYREHLENYASEYEMYNLPFDKSVLPKTHTLQEVYCITDYYDSSFSDVVKDVKKKEGVSNAIARDIALNIIHEKEEQSLLPTSLQFGQDFVKNYLAERASQIYQDNDGLQYYNDKYAYNLSDRYMNKSSRKRHNAKKNHIGQSFDNIGFFGMQSKMHTEKKDNKYIILKIRKAMQEGTIEYKRSVKPVKDSTLIALKDIGDTFNATLETGSLIKVLSLGIAKDILSRLQYKDKKRVKGFLINNERYSKSAILSM